MLIACGKKKIPIGKKIFVKWCYMNNTIAISNIVYKRLARHISVGTLRFSQLIILLLQRAGCEIYFLQKITISLKIFLHK
ncbi:hypothetical protein LMG8286_00588 [Campylobacter suis]|uniref:Uncharacterized protein n=1 Tax=Campylobacter suis TaxID=2790657 RepID=A0ABN7K618_9BACT|nr:hypothetical protein LMG8286_00588 [Campylobacter suis]